MLRWLKEKLCRHRDGFVYWDHLSDECPRCGKLVQTRGW